MPTGSASFSRGRLRPVAALTLEIKKSAYLNRPKSSTLMTTEMLSHSFFRFSDLAMAKPQI